MLKTNLAKHLVFAGLFCLYVIVLQVTHIYSPLTYLFEIPTPTTGITRACLAFLRGDIERAFTIHPLFILAAPFGLSIYLYLFYKKKTYLWTALGFASLFFVVYLIRIFTGTIFY